MATPTFQQFITPTFAGNGLQAESAQERILTELAVIASGQNPDGTVAPSAGNQNPGTPVVTPGAQMTTAVLTAGGTNQRGNVTGTSVAVPAGGVLFSVAFSSSYATTPIVTPSGANNAVNVGLYISAVSAAGFTVSSTIGTLGTTTLSIDYTVTP